MRMRSIAWTLAACICALTQPVLAENAPLAANNGAEPLAPRSLRQQQVLDDAEPTKAVLADEAKKPIHRVYDPVTGLFCELLGECHVCPASEKDEVYCRETGHRQEMKCPLAADDAHADVANRGYEIRFQACTPVEKANPLKSVLTFELVMSGVLIGCFVLLQKERRKHVSMFDLRKEPRQRNTLLGTTTKSAD
ncbi:hypothetical protein Poli38472_013183 [Pythium oligandrum]|uniref:Uncharacterized protein n=1 Tax=Pythium oligandrum TaxID=41045 RepID=A0A8K1FD80_PYTOL|nr:hypothetical protein Poli38472_013183 [Pythium oligandrum]|eukprot:TMW55292.1 hypothetical protein Poli38472_013183 [Pythium oligandrum]